MSPLLGWRLRELRLPTWAVFHELEPEQKGYLLASLAASPGEARGSRLEDQESRYPGIREGYLQGRWHLAHQAFLEAGFGDLEAWSEVDRLVRRAGPDPAAEFSLEQALGPLAPLVREGSGTGASKAHGALQPLDRPQLRGNSNRLDPAAAGPVRPPGVVRTPRFYPPRLQSSLASVLGELAVGAVLLSFLVRAVWSILR